MIKLIVLNSSLLNDIGVMCLKCTLQLSSKGNAHLTKTLSGLYPSCNLSRSFPPRCAFYTHNYIVLSVYIYFILNFYYSQLLVTYYSHFLPLRKLCGDQVRDWKKIQHFCHIWCSYSLFYHTQANSPKQNLHT